MLRTADPQNPLAVAHHRAPAVGWQPLTRSEYPDPVTLRPAEPQAATEPQDSVRFRVNSINRVVRAVPHPVEGQAPRAGFGFANEYSAAARHEKTPGSIRIHGRPQALGRFAGIHSLEAFLDPMDEALSG